MTRTGGQATRRRLVEEAIRLFGKRGFKGTSLEAVATAAGVRKQTLLYYFPSKDALLADCVEETSQRVAEALTRALEETPESRKAEAVVHTLFSLAEDWPEFAQFVREASRLGPDVIERFAGVLEPLRLRALAFLANGMRTGLIRRQDPALLLFTLYTAVVGSITEAGVLRAVVGEDESRLALHRREQEVIAFVRNALAPREGDRTEAGAEAAG